MIADDDELKPLDFNHLNLDDFKNSKLSAADIKFLD